MKEKSVMLKSIVDQYEGISALLEDMPDSKLILELIIGYYKGLYEATIEGKSVAWINFGIPPELFWAMDITPFAIDAVNGQSAVMNVEGTLKWIDSAHTHIPDYLCSTNKVVLGAAFEGDLEPPAILAVPSSPCDSNLATYPLIAEYFGFPYYCVDMPYAINGAIPEKGLQYMAKEIKGLVAALEKATGKRLDFDRLKETMECVNKCHEYILKLSELRQGAVPSPYSSMEALAETPLITCVMGQPKVLEYYEKQYEKTKAKVEKGEGHLPDEKIRLVWIYGAPVFDYSVFDWLEQEYGAVSVGNMSTNMIKGPIEDISTPDAIFRGLAEKTANMPMVRECGGTWDVYLDAAIDLCQRYKADAAVFGGHVACKGNWAIAKMVKDRVHEEIGVPVLNLEVDLFDPRVTPAEAARGMIEDFFELNF
jgi:benzoyl-CoA reductase/2-hydroxyglutaryl-CoA dehydratase subunit BcrC/BadD/HgdB